MPSTRRERLREALVTDIKACALAQLEDGGATAVTLRGIAREIGVSPAALYGYFDSLDDLFTGLITDGFNDIADAVDAAVDPDAPLETRLLRGLLAYREWAITNPARFRLCYFSPVPGYQAPPDGPTLSASLRSSVAFLRILRVAWEAGTIPQPPPGPPVDTSKFAEFFGLEMTTDQLRSATECWGEFHGLVALEIAGHIGDNWTDPAALYEANMRSMIRRIGLPDPA